MMHKKNVLLSLPLLIPGILNARLSDDAHKTHIKFTANAALIKEADGTFGLNGLAIQQMMSVRKGIRIIQFGKKIKGTQHVRGAYSITGDHKKYALKQLASIEARAQTKKDQKLLKNIKKTLEEVKKDFSRITTPFLHQAHEMKSLTLPLIREWCKKRDRKNSLLLKWNETQQDEMELFNALVTSCHVLDVFL